MEAVVQEHSMGCGVACVAYILGLTYQKALKLFEVPENAATKGYYCRDLIKALAKAKKNYKFSYVKKEISKELKDKKIIVYCKVCSKYSAGHYLARSENGEWMNPWINFPHIVPAIAGFEPKLPAKAMYVIFPI